MRRALLAPLLALLAACPSSEGPTKAERARLAPHLDVSLPESATRVSARHAGSVVLSGYGIDASSVTSGGTFDVALYFEVESPLPRGTRVFTHLLDAKGDLVVNADRHGLVRELYPPDQWRPGDRIADVITLHVPPHVAGETTIRVGFFRGDERLELTLADGGRAEHVDLEGPEVRRGRVASAHLPTLEVARALDIDVDGTLDEETWKSAAETASFRHTMTGAETRVSARARMAWDDEFLYFAVEVLDGDLRTPFTERDDPLWEADVVELFLDPSGRGVDYLELQVSPRGVVFDTHYARRRVPAPIGNADFDSKIEAAVSLRGTLDDSLDDVGYTVEARVPFEALASRSPRAKAPSRGDTWRANFYVIDIGRGRTSAAAWSPPLVPDFHYPPRFGRLVFVD
jgi:hypothetical protein